MEPIRLIPPTLNVHPSPHIDAAVWLMRNESLDPADRAPLPDGVTAEHVAAAKIQRDHRISLNRHAIERYKHELRSPLPPSVSVRREAIRPHQEEDHDDGPGVLVAVTEIALLWVIGIAVWSIIVDVLAWMGAQ